MCGILGRARSRGAGEREGLTHGLDTIAHRGPDDVGMWWSADCRVALGHRRLAIIDLSPAGHQPMLDASGTMVIVFNGEIYNYVELREELRAKGHSFLSASDTEVILAAYREWDVACLNRLNGQFAFALFDSVRQRVFLARDRAGEKPLFYHLDESGLRFASELKALMVAGVPRMIDHEALDCYLAMGYVPGDRCILRGVKKLPPAHAMTFELNTGSTRVWRYWKLPDFDEKADTGEAALLVELEILLEDAVRRQLVADVPVGILLSGGVDSSLITAMAVRTAPKVLTFTVRFPGFGCYDETEHARLIARHFGTTHVELEAAPTSAEMLPTLARQYDEPMADSSMIPTYLVSRLVRDQCTVALGGDGGDELFGGYTYYSRLLRVERAARFLPRVLRRGVADAGAAVLPVGFKGRNWLSALGADFRREVPPVQWLFDWRSRGRLMATHQWTPVAEAIHAARVPAHRDLLQRATRMDFENYLAEDILVKVDRASMLTSLEVRAPLLDYRIVEFAFSRVRSEQKATPNGLKLLLKALCDRVLPRGFDHQRKQGFSIPLAHWLQNGPWATMVSDVLLSGDTIFDRNTVQSLLDGQRRGLDNGERLFALTLFELWRREYGVTL